MKNGNQGVVKIHKDTDYIAGANSPLTFVSNIPNSNWNSFLPDGERQSDGLFDSLACVSFYWAHTIETQLNWLYSQNKIPAQSLSFFSSNGYIMNGKFNISERFIAKVSNTDETKGNWPPRVRDALKQFGVVPESAWPFDYSKFTWNDYYLEIPQNILDLGKESLKYLEFFGEWVWQNENESCPPDLLKLHLQQAPLGLTVAICPGWDADNPINGCGVGTDHEILLWNVLGSDFILDNYLPFQKALSSNYFLGYVFKGIVNLIPQQVPIQTPPLTPQQVNTYSKILDLIKQILVIFQRSLKPQTGSMNGSPSWKLNVQDIQKWINNTLVFLAPVVVIYLAFVIDNVKTLGFSWSDFSPSPMVVGAMALYVLNVAFDFFKKLVNNNQ